LIPYAFQDEPQMSTAALYEEFLAEQKRVSLMQSCGHVLDWDRETYMPRGGSEHRANQLSLLAGVSHQWATSPRIGELLGQLETEDLGDADSPKAVNVREARRDYDRATKLPQQLVEEMSKTTSLAQQAWIDSRHASDFSVFEPWLDKIVKLKREEADAIGYGDGVPYDALLDEYEPGTTTADVTAAFSPLRDELVSLVAAIADSGVQQPLEIITREYPIAAQREFGLKAAAAIGFDFERGRLDETAHPFCSDFGPGDCRLTTRYDAHHFPGAFFGTLHESGHGIYEQGLNGEAFGTGMGQAVSLGIHESQSRLWENFVGRSQAFWDHFYGDAKQRFPTALGDVSVEQFYSAINDVRPSLIRVEADEVTYNLHIMLRFELEQQMISGELNAADVPGAWNEKFAHYFGMTPPNDADGCLQDVHWGAGLFGYFPTYALGNMYAAHFFNAADRELGGLHEMFARGEFQPLREWLNKNIHQRGKQYAATVLVKKTTGESLSHEPLVQHLRSKFEPLFGLS
jgi:carboxypeptidase Taq